MNICEGCVEIACYTNEDILDEAVLVPGQKRVRKYLQYNKDKPKYLQCPLCGCFWAHTYQDTWELKKHLPWNERWQIPLWHDFYVPIQCVQRKCGEHATHRVKGKKGKLFKCDKHSGVCIIA